MTTFVATLFVVYIIGIVVQLIDVASEREATLSNIANILFCVGMGTWAGFLLFAK